MLISSLSDQPIITALLNFFYVKITKISPVSVHCCSPITFFLALESSCSKTGSKEEDLPQHWEGGQRPPGALAQEWAHSGSLKRLQAAGRLLVKQRGREKADK